MNLSNRLRAVVMAMTNEYRRFKQLETETGIQADTWKSWFHGRQRPTADMIEAAGKAWPAYAFWLTTGIPDEAYGHAAPGDEGFPTRGGFKENSAAYFKRHLELQELAVQLTRAFLDMEDMADIDVDDQWTRTAVTVLCSSTRSEHPEFTGINLTKFNAANAAHSRAEKLRRAEVMIETDIPRSDYDLTEMLIEKVEKTLKGLPPESQSRLQQLIVKEKEGIARNRAWEEKNPERAKELKEMLKKYV